MRPSAFRATVVNMAGNTLLFALKLAAGLLSGSIALLSDAFNSLTDMVSSAAVFICVRISEKEADEGHPFGHSRAEPIAGIVVAVLAGILGFEVIKASVQRLVSDGEVRAGPFAFAALAVTMAVKGAMAWYFRSVGRRTGSPAITASAADSLCDVWVSAAALTGIIGVRAGYPLLDPLAGLVISGWIIYTGYSIGMENIDYLMGKSPPRGMLEAIEHEARSVDGVRDVGDVKAHYVGNFIHVEIPVKVDKDLSTLDSHEIGKRVEEAVDRIEAIEKAFIHIDPV
ncbi:MAG TPA: cation transporter [Deltaproteobacteria bacterium]|nr:cation transporter [Deltaproteobacteria bacterium]